jgi:hypothetical protein
MILETLITLVSNFIEYEEVLEFTYQFCKVYLANYYDSKRKASLIK